MRVFPAMTRLLSSNRIADQRHWAIQTHRMNTPVVRFYFFPGWLLPERLRRR